MAGEPLVLREVGMGVRSSKLITCASPWLRESPQLVSTIRTPFPRDPKTFPVSRDPAKMKALDASSDFDGISRSVQDP